MLTYGDHGTEKVNSIISNTQIVFEHYNSHHTMGPNIMNILIGSLFKEHSFNMITTSWRNLFKPVKIDITLVPY
jgi:hypothetical protein